jgi:ATP-dependent protease ClpP protease subunit
MKKKSRNNRKVNQPVSKSNSVEAQPKTVESSKVSTPKQGIYSEYLNQNLNINQIMEERKIQLKRISQLREDRAILVYAADFRKANIAPTHINSLDLMPINDQLSILQGERLDFILETPGGFGDAAEDIVKLIRNKFQEVNIIVPGTAKSAGTIIAMAGDDILMEPVSMFPAANRHFGKTYFLRIAGFRVRRFCRFQIIVRKTKPFRLIYCRNETRSKCFGTITKTGNCSTIF